MKHNQRGIAHLALIVLAVVVVAAVGGTGYLVAHHNKSTNNTPKVMATPGKATLSITSDPVGVQMAAKDVICDGSKLNKLTPYTCSQTGKDLETIVTAPATAVVSGKTYSFTTWDGCSPSNADKKICKIEVKRGQAKTLKATYQAVPAASSTGSTANGPIGCPAQSQYIITGPKQINTSNPAKLVLYNKAKSPLQPTYVQLWSGSTCKDVALATPLVATKSQYNTGLGISSSDVPAPAGGHSYAAVFDSGNSEHPEVIIRDDGFVMTDLVRLTAKFGINQNTVWYPDGWTDQKTLLFHIGVKPATPGTINYHQLDDVNPANWFYYNVETDSYTNAAPPWNVR